MLTALFHNGRTHLTWPCSCIPARQFLGELASEDGQGAAETQLPCAQDGKYLEMQGCPCIAGS